MLVQNYFVPQVWFSGIVTQRLDQVNCLIIESILIYGMNLCYKAQFGTFTGVLNRPFQEAWNREITRCIPYTVKSHHTVQ